VEIYNKDLTVDFRRALRSVSCGLIKRTKMDKKKILIIDDDVDMVEVIGLRLEASGYEVVTANDGLIGLERARKENPDLILLDIRMPNMDGHTMLRQLKKYGEKTRLIPVIVITGMGELKDLFDLEGAADYIVKPFTDEEFFSKIEIALRKKE
jgi:CheY-like chemotaxis protein